MSNTRARVGGGARLGARRTVRGAARSRVNAICDAIADLERAANGLDALVASTTRAIDAASMSDALTSLESAGTALDAWLDAAGPLRQQLADAITAQSILLAADAQAAAVGGDDGRGYEKLIAHFRELNRRRANLDALAAGFRELNELNRKGERDHGR